MLKFQPKPSPIPDGYPSWASWSSRNVFLPEEFHSLKHFKSALSIAKEALKDPSVLKNGKVDAPLLLLGLMYREVARAMEIEPGAPTEDPPQLVNSTFGIEQVRQIEKLLDGVKIPG
jgi:hypothetical protein